MRIDHIGYLVKNIDRAAADFVSLGYAPRGEAQYDEARHADIAFLDNGAYVVELVAPRGESSVAWKLLKRNGVGPYHICYEASDMDEADRTLREQGYVRMLDKQPAPALGGRAVAFYTGRNMGMIELVEAGGE
ncbi:MAG: VOC family protein [Clostridiales Family XIII bacterium]|nr:VOC family protein [Clostridiales Family XIII bacterium]